MRGVPTTPLHAKYLPARAMAVMSCVCFLRQAAGCVGRSVSDCLEDGRVAAAVVAAATGGGGGVCVMRGLPATPPHSASRPGRWQVGWMDWMHTDTPTGILPPCRRRLCLNPRGGGLLHDCSSSFDSLNILFDTTYTHLSLRFPHTLDTQPLLTVSPYQRKSMRN